MADLPALKGELSVVTSHVFPRNKANSIRLQALPTLLNRRNIRKRFGGLDRHSVTANKQIVCQYRSATLPAIKGSIFRY